MDKLTNYRQILRKIIDLYASYKPAVGEIKVEAIVDTKTDHYEVMQTGWQGERRIHGTVIHLDIIDSKIWIQHDGTNRPVEMPCWKRASLKKTSYLDFILNMSVKTLILR